MVAFGLQVYDVRMVPRMTSTFAFNAGPAMVCFSPKFSSMLLVAAGSGIFTLTDVNSNAFNPMYQVSCNLDLQRLLAPLLIMAAGCMHTLLLDHGDRTLASVALQA